MRICKKNVANAILFFSLTLVFAQHSGNSIQVPTAPIIVPPTITGPTIPTLQMSSVPDGATIRTSEETNANKEPLSQDAPSELSSEITATALETISSLFSGDSNSISEGSLSEFGNISSLGDLSSLLNEEMSISNDAKTQALLQEILFKLSELETKIDNLEKNEQTEE